MRPRSLLYVVPLAIMSTLLGPPSLPTAVAAPVVPLPFDIAADLAVDGERRLAFISGGPGSDTVVAMSYSGRRRAAITNQPGAAGLLVDSRRRTLWVALSDAGAISEIDLDSLRERRRWNMPGAGCPTTLEAAAGLVWFGYGCLNETGRIGRLDPSGRLPVKLDMRSTDGYEGPPLLASAGPGGARLAVISTRESEPPLRVLDATDNLRTLAERREVYCDSVRDLAVTRDKRVTVACESTHVFSLKDLRRIETIRHGGGAYAATASGQFQAINSSDFYEPDLIVLDRGREKPVRTYDFYSAYHEASVRRLVWEPGGRHLFAVVGEEVEGQWQLRLSFVVLRHASRRISVPSGDIDRDGYAELVIGAPGEDEGEFKDVGIVSMVPGSRSGLRTSETVLLSPEQPSDVDPPPPGPQAGTASATGDFDGNGHADVAIGAPETTQTIDQVYVHYSSALRLATWSQTIDGDDWEDRYGAALAAGDFNSDGYDDLAVGSPDNDQVFVSTGGPYGLADWSDPSHTWSQDTPGVPGLRHPGEAFGSALAVGDANGDGFADLAIAAPLDIDQDGKTPRGAVTLLLGSKRGLTAKGSQRWAKDTPGVAGESHRCCVNEDDGSDLFGFALTFGDYDGDGRDDLVVGSPGTPVRGKAALDAGAVNVLRGARGGLTADGDLYFTQDTPAVKGRAQNDDFLGGTFAAGDIDRDGYAELVVGAQGDESIFVIPGGRGGPRLDEMRTINQASPGVPERWERGDYFGTYLRIQHYGRTRYADLAIGAPGENNAAGAVTVLFGTRNGLTTRSARLLTQNTPGIPGDSEPGDYFGYL